MLVEDATGTDPQRIHAAEPSTKRMPCPRFALQQTQDILDRVDKRPAQLEQLTTSAPGDASDHALAKATDPS
jgi:hypothetical protein